VDASVAQRVLGEAFDLIDRLGGIRVSDKFRVQITRMVWWFQRKTKIVHGEDVLQEFRFLEITDAARLACRVELMCECVGAHIKIVIVS